MKAFGIQKMEEHWVIALNRRGRGREGARFPLLAKGLLSVTSLKKNQEERPSGLWKKNMRLRFVLELREKMGREGSKSSSR